MKTFYPIAFLFLVVSTMVSAATPAAQGGRVYIISPANNSIVSNPVVVQFGLENMGVAPAGVVKSNTGHHHLLVDVEDLPDMSSPIPSDEKHRHFGGGQTQVELSLEPGEHTLQLLLGDENHIPHAPPVLSEKITITVK